MDQNLCDKLKVAKEAVEAAGLPSDGIQALMDMAGCGGGFETQGEGGKGLPIPGDDSGGHGGTLPTGG